MSDPEFRWPDITKDPDDTLPMQLGVWSMCALFWTPNEEYDLGDFVWPRIFVIEGQIVKGANGFVYECTTAGRSASKEPKWAVTADVAMATPDGSVIWTPRIGASQGISPATSPVISAITPSDGVTNDLTTSAVVVNEGTKLLCDYSGGTVDLSYEIEFRFMIGGRQRVGRQLVSIVKK